MLATADKDNTVNLWQSDGKLVLTLKGHGDRINSVSFSPTSQLVASASDDQTVRLWDFDGNTLNIKENCWRCALSDIVCHPY